MSERLIAFWSYDSFPYTLHSEVDSFDQKPGVVKVKGYGGSRFAYRHIAPYEHAEKAVIELEVLKDAYSSESKDLSKKYHALLKECLGKHGIPLPTNISVLK